MVHIKVMALRHKSPKQPSKHCRSMTHSCEPTGLQHKHEEKDAEKNKSVNLLNSGINKQQRGFLPRLRKLFHIMDRSTATSPHLPPPLSSPLWHLLPQQLNPQRRGEANADGGGSPSARLPACERGEAHVWEERAPGSSQPRRGAAWVNHRGDAIQGEQWQQPPLTSLKGNPFTLPPPSLSVQNALALNQRWSQPPCSHLAFSSARDSCFLKHLRSVFTKVCTLKEYFIVLSAACDHLRW